MNNYKLRAERGRYTRGFYVYAGDSLITSLNDRFDSREAQELANLFAASPDLFVAAQLAKEMFAAIVQELPYLQNVIAPVQESITKALAKAHGESEGESEADNE